MLLACDLASLQCLATDLLPKLSDLQPSLQRIDTILLPRDDALQRGAPRLRDGDA